MTDNPKLAPDPYGCPYVGTPKPCPNCDCRRAPPQETTNIQPAPDQADEEDFAAIAAIYRFSSDGDRDRAIEAMRMALRRSRQRAQPAPVEQDELVERVARALYQCEKERSDIADAVISAAAGKTVSVGMEPWEECWQVFYSDARAVLSVVSPSCGLDAEQLRKALSEIGEIASVANEFHPCPDCQSVGEVARAALSALSTLTPARAEGFKAGKLDRVLAEKLATEDPEVVGCCLMSACHYMAVFQQIERALGSNDHG